MDKLEKDLFSLKQELKCWESMFTRKYGRKPSKKDIDDSAAEIKDSYIAYSVLKKKKHESDKKSSYSIEDNDDVFGANLLKKPISEIKPPKLTKIKDIHSARRPILKKKKFVEIDKLESAEIVFEEPTKNEQPVMAFEIENKINIPGESLNRKSISALRKRQSLFTNYSKLSVDWLSNSNNLANKNDEIHMCNDETGIKCARNPSANTQNNILKCKDISPSGNNLFTGSFDQSDIFVETSFKSTFDQSLLHSNDSISTMSPKKTDSNSDCLLGLKTVELIRTNESDRKDTLRSKKISINSQVCDRNISNEFCDRSNFKSQKNDTTGEVYDKNEYNEKVEERKQTKDSELLSNIDKNKKLKEEVKQNFNQNLNAFEKKVKRKRTETDADEENVDPKSKKIKIKKVNAKRLVSDNFVKIDIKKKTYVRAGKKLTGAQYKRKQWKKKTSFEQPSKKGWQVIGNKKTCFKCGGEGHWAKFCRGLKKVDPFSKLDAEKQDFENLEDNKQSCFTFMENNIENEVNNTRKKFSMEDIMNIEPIWPREPYVDEPCTTINECLIPSVDGKPSLEAYDYVKNELKVFGFESFRVGQHEAIARIVSGLSTLVILSTGSGKSLCYQLPAFLYYKQKKYLTIVVSPLVALMQDQVASLPPFLPGACLNSSMTKLQQKRVIEKVKNGKIAVLLISPETLVSGGFGSGILPSKSSLPPIAFACIDEAHCLSEWSHNFRPSYLKVCKVLRERYNISNLLGITATASHATAISVMQHLDIPLEGSIIRDPHPIPPNLHITASRDCNRDEALTELLQMKPFLSCASIIIYVTRRTDADRLASMLRTNLPAKHTDENAQNQKDATILKGKRKNAKKPFWWNIESYHAGLKPSQRRQVQINFMSGELRIVVATVAFGMGLDKSDVRAVIHYNMPSSFENYVQEIGRAGRDGKPSYVHVFLDDEGNDLYELRRHIYGNTVDRSTIQKFVDIAFPPCKCEELCAKHEILNSNNQENMEKMSVDEINEMFSAEFCSQMINDCSLIEDVQVNKCCYEENVEDEVNTNVCNETRLKSDIKNKICSGHRVTFNIDSTVQALDMPEVNIATLMAYLELHPKQWLKVLNPLRDWCSVKCYGGPEQFQLLAKRFAPIALAIKSLPKDQLRNINELRSIDFSFAEIADQMCWDVLTVSREVRYLQWNMSFALDAPLNTTGNSGVIVECDQLSFHILTASGLSNDDKDEICDYLHKSTTRQEEQRVLQLDALYNLFRDLSEENYYELKSDIRVDSKARSSISDYFLCSAEQQLAILKEMCTCDLKVKTSDRRWNAISNDINSLLCAYPDQNFTGRAIARIFQGIDSPCYPAWSIGSDKRFWRQYLDVDFNELRNFCGLELVKYRRR
ncbi:ATP-dependent DNA helicase Q4 isoform X4 [Hydra vulgaris]|uniref:DNA 3'-5' helicase n=2 Tax=Hydra vulgaris TaxID=6087 RepID=A0ABM4DL62_HYDVU